jgi:hypothetical protein
MKKEITNYIQYFFLLISMLSANTINAQRKPQYTHYINNTLT